MFSGCAEEEPVEVVPDEEEEITEEEKEETIILDEEIRADFYVGEFEWAASHVWANIFSDYLHDRTEGAFLEERPGIEVIEITGDEQNRFKEIAIAAHEDLFEFGGPNAQVLYETLLNDIEQAKVELDID